MGDTLAVQWLGLWALTAKRPGMISGWGIKIPHALQKKKKILYNIYCLEVSILCLVNISS